MFMRRFFQFLAIATLVLLSGCGGKYSKVNSATTYGNSATFQSAVTYDRGEALPIASAPMPIERIITHRANIRVEVDTLDKAKSSLEELVEQSGGHVVNARLYEDGYHASIRVPSKLLSSTMEAIANLGDKISQSISQDDVTNQFVDNEARLKNLRLFRDKMTKLLNQTTNIEEIVKIERELRRVQTEIDSLEGQLKYLKDAVALSPIDVTFEEKTVYGPLGYIANGVWWVTKKLFIIK